MSIEANTATAAQREQFERDGYLVIEEPVASEETLDEIIEQLSGLYGQKYHRADNITYYPNRVMGAWHVNEHVRELALKPSILGLLEGLYGRKPMPFQTINFRIGTQQAPHSDALHFSTIPEGFMAGVWIALEDMDMDNGPLVYYPGSHRFPFVTMEDVGVEAKSENYKDYEQYVAELIEREGLEPRYGTISKGQALIWAANLLHGGAHQNDRSRSRHSQVTHYFFEDCKYYVPMLSEGDNVRWRDPEWVV